MGYEFCSIEMPGATPDIPSSLFEEKGPPLDEDSENALWGLVRENRSTTGHNHVERGVGAGAVTGSEIKIVETLIQ